MSDQPAPVPPSSRGPAPPLPEKPPSVAERTRLLRSSFRKEDGEKPKVPEKPRPNQPQPQPTALEYQQNRRSNGSLSNGERSPSPPPVTAGPTTVQKPPVPEKNVGQAPLATFGDSNREVNGRPPASTAAPVCIQSVYQLTEQANFTHLSMVTTVI
ncbi:hypothetical protein PoB_000370600 [Plakobranchus ocellatus]|uniref:Uncharacterized protein n=1 Tax=Plakobranchus ocellatus TaxID=259542 RepID=A0AAV3Y474_9GAST|nr:hypothetical protein PoB_000370600 [Plakobranchus ocellatus]